MGRNGAQPQCGLGASQRNSSSSRNDLLDVRSIFDDCFKVSAHAGDPCVFPARLIHEEDASGFVDKEIDVFRVNVVGPTDDRKRPKVKDISVERTASSPEERATNNSLPQHKNC